jgi:predicted O-methyltransferase YrrM
MTPFSDPAGEFARHLTAYTNTAECNDRVFAEFTTITKTDPLLSAHRRHVEAHNLGFGDPAFHALWRGLLALAHQRHGSVNALEIGVFKGQVISLWALIARHYSWPVRIHAISPLAGQPLPKQSLWRSILYRLSPLFRERVDSGDFYPEDDYVAIVRQHFATHGLSFDDVRLVRGFSTDPSVRSAVATDRFELIYIDGDHTYAGALADIEHYAPKIVPGGWLVMDDAAFGLPGTTFWKGYETVARACLRLPALGFDNVINVGHNRVFQRRA